jgi:hypothetical protein
MVVQHCLPLFRAFNSNPSARPAKFMQQELLASQVRHGSYTEVFFQPPHELIAHLAIGIQS